jgi:hypothetical protein
MSEEEFEMIVLRVAAVNSPGYASMFESKTGVLVMTAVKMRLLMMVSKHLRATPSPLYLDNNLPNDRSHKTITY